MKNHESQDIEGQENTRLCQMGQVPEIKGKDHWAQKAQKTAHSVGEKREQSQTSDTVGVKERLCCQESGRKALQIIHPLLF